MARKERLPDNVTAYIDRHGKRRYRFRRVGYKTGYFQNHPNSPDGREELAAFNAGRAGIAPRHAHGTVGWVAARYYVSVAFRGQKSAQTERTARLILEKFVAEFAHDLIHNFKFSHIEAILSRAAVKRVVDGRTVGGLHASKNLRGELKPFFAYAIKTLELKQPNPVDQADKINAPTRGFHTWSEAEIAQYRAHHPMGTKARLALEIFLWTLQRRADASTFGRRHIINGQIEFVASKTGATVWLPAAPQLIEAIDAMTVTGTETYLVTDFGKPFSRAGLGNKMRQWCNEAGLPHCSAHGLRKATAVRGAELGASDRELMGLGAWTTPKQVGTYTAAVSQKRMARQAMDPVIAFDLANRVNPDKTGND